MRQLLVPFPFVVVGAITMGLLAMWILDRGDWSDATAAERAAPVPELVVEVQMLRAEVERLRTLVPDQAHAMQDVDYHFANLWFAGRVANWPLAKFYFNETRSHLRWAVRIIPVRKDSAGNEVKLEDILQSLENTPLKQLEAAIDGQDSTQFVAAYEATLTGCYACHKASDKPYLRPRIPDRAATEILNLDPHAAWPR